MSLEYQFQAIVELVVVAFLSMLIGMDRERLHKSAGMRTHMLTGLGACLFTQLSIYAFPGSDNSRIAANVVTGIGFLAAGVIVKRSGNIHDLTTAASIWVTAAVGMAIGAGAWLLALAATVLIWTILAVIRRFSKEDAQVREQQERAPKGT